MNLFQAYVINEFIKMSRHKLVGLTAFVVLLVSVAFAWQFADSIAAHSDSLAQNSGKEIGGFFRFYTIFIYPFPFLLFIWSVELEDNSHSFDWIRIGILHTPHLKLAKFVVAYTGYLVLVVLAFLLFYLAYSIELADAVSVTQPGGDLWQVFLNYVRHYVLLSIPLGLTVFLISFYTRKFYIGIASLILLHLVGLFIFDSWAIPFHAVHQATAIETIIIRNWVSYTRQDILVLYLVSLLYVLAILFLDFLARRILLNRALQNA